MFLKVVGTVWGFMKSIAATIINSTFGAYTGRPLSEDAAAYTFWGMILGITAIILILKKGMKSFD
ncbi:MAG: hypothetical protein D6679_00935 [Candidatus Hydrogenedentota bacterium]|nr:MAG: hypothetical protein D6679_00935 [Candidatus Hydrogenedentota bacterium]